jgi:uncharacterized membrane protein YphA (DoxX/SURF4 family)
MPKPDSETLDLSSIYWPLRLAYGLVPLLAGLDKFVGVLADWEKYLSPTVAGLLPMSPHAFLAIVGVIEIAAGLLVLAGVTRLGGLIVAAWLVAIAVNLVAAGVLDVAVRDLVMAVGAYTLSRVAALRGEALVPGTDLAVSPYHREAA